jgi:hypothetical protein
MSCALVTSTELEKDLDAAKEVTRGVGVPLVNMAGQPWFVANRSPVMRAMVPPVLEVMERARLVLFPSSDDRELAPIDHAYTSHYGDPYSEEGDHLASTRGPFEQQRRQPLTGEA